MNIANNEALDIWIVEQIPMFTQEWLDSHWWYRLRAIQIFLDYSYIENHLKYMLEISSMPIWLVLDTIKDK